MEEKKYSQCLNQFRCGYAQTEAAETFGGYLNLDFCTKRM